jgi:hypothetical protein
VVQAESVKGASDVGNEVDRVLWWLELVPPSLPPLLVELFVADLCSVWRLFWNQIVTDFISLFWIRNQKSVSATLGNGRDVRDVAGAEAKKTI